MNPVSYHAAWLRRAAHGALLAIGFKGRAEAVRTVLLWAVSVLLLYKVDWRGVPVVGTPDPGASSEVRLGLCIIGGVLLVFIAAFLWQLVVQPAAMDRERLAEVDRGAAEARRREDEIRAQAAREAAEAAAREDALRAQLRGLTDDIEAFKQAEAILQRLSDLHRAGRALYQQEASPEVWSQRMGDWAAEVEGIIAAEFSISVLHRYRGPGNGGEIRTDWSWPSGTDSWLKARYTAKLQGLDDLISGGAPVRNATLHLSMAPALRALGE